MNTEEHSVIPSILAAHCWYNSNNLSFAQFFLFALKERFSFLLTLTATTHRLVRTRNNDSGF